MVFKEESSCDSTLLNPQDSGRFKYIPVPVVQEMSVTGRVVATLSFSTRTTVDFELCSMCGDIGYSDLYYVGVGHSYHLS